MHGLLKTVGSNKDHPKPIKVNDFDSIYLTLDRSWIWGLLNQNLFSFCCFKIFEIGDVTLRVETKDVGATNRRHLSALYCGATSGFEVDMLILFPLFSQFIFLVMNDTKKL